MLVDVVDIGVVVVLDVLGAVDGVEEDHLERFVVVHVVWHIGGVCNAVVGVVQISNLKGGVLKGPHAYEVRDPAISVDNLHQLITISFHPILT